MLALQYLRSALFNVQMYIAMPVIGIVYLPYALANRRGAHAACRAYARYVIWTASWMIGLKTEVRGSVPQDEVLVAAKHQSFFDIMVIFAQIPYGKFIMKKELMWAPVLGWYAKRLGCVPVDRGGRAKAVTQMLADVKSGAALPGQLSIYPQGTRVAPGVKVPYKQGTGILYEQLGQDCVPVATNIGVFWPKRGLLRKPGIAVVEFLPHIPAGQPRDRFMEQLEEAIEVNSDRLMAEAGFEAGPAQ